MSDFTHLHLHSQYSLLDGAIRLDRLFPRLHELGMNSVALTDHGNMFGAVDFYQHAKKADIKPIIGCEAYVAGSRGMRDRTVRESYHLVLLAKNNEGYQNLTYLISKGFLEGYYYHPRIDKNILRKHSAGLIGLSACLSGEVAYHAKKNQPDEARHAAQEYAQIFEPGQFFLELQHNGLEEQELANELIKQIAEDEGLPLVATNDCHYLSEKDAFAHDVLLCISTNKTLDDPNRMRHDTDTLYLRSAEEMARLFDDTPEALENTVRIAESCNVELDLGNNYLPAFEVPDGFDRNSYLSDRAWAGLERHLKRVPPEKHDFYRKRLEYEIGVIHSMGFSGYFLIVWDFIKYAKEHGIPVGPGRGSGAGSLVAFCLGITDLDPLPYDLIFERFLNPERISMPDFDIDFCQDRRGEVIQYVSEKYGRDRVGQIATFGQLKARSAIKDVGRVMGLSFQETDRISKLVPPGPKVTLEKALAEEPRLTEIQREKDEYRQLIEVAKSLEGLNRQWGMHAAGVVIAQKPLWEHVPVLKGDGDVLITQFAKDEVEAAGLVKFDFLGLKTLTVIAHALRMIKANHGELDIRTIPLDDPDVYRLLTSGETDGVFQVESDGFKELMKKLKPDRFEDIVAAVALYRPGPLGAGMVDDYIDRKHGRSKITYINPVLEPILNSTYGVIIYQEQVMRIAVDLSGFTMGQADTLRKAMGKKKADLLAKLKEQFISGAMEHNQVDEKVSRELFEKIEKFAEYAFNKSHSAAYALISYQTAFLKAHYPAEFMAALLSSEMSDTDKLVKHIGKVRRMGIDVLPPDVNRSERSFSVADGKILFGLGAVKGVGDSAIDAIVEARKDGPFCSMFDFASRLDSRKVNKKLVDALIKSGGLDGMGHNRASMAASMEMVFDWAQKRQKEKASGQRSLLDLMTASDSCDDEPQEDHPPLVSVDEWPERERLNKERESLGFYISGHPLDRYERVLRRLKTTPIDNLQSCLEPGARPKDVSLAALVVTMRDKPTKTGGRMAIVGLEDLSGRCEAVVFTKEFAEAEELLRSQRPLLLSCNATLDDDEGARPRIVIREVSALKDASKQKTSQVHFRLPANDIDAPRLERLRTILRKHRGKCAAFLHIRLPDHGPETILRLPESVSFSEKVEEEVDSLFNGPVTQYL